MTPNSLQVQNSAPLNKWQWTKRAEVLEPNFELCLKRPVQLQHPVQGDAITKASWKASIPGSSLPSLTCVLLLLQGSANIKSYCSAHTVLLLIATLCLWLAFVHYIWSHVQLANTSIHGRLSTPCGLSNVFRTVNFLKNWTHFSLTTGNFHWMITLNN